MALLLLIVSAILYYFDKILTLIPVIPTNLNPTIITVMKLKMTLQTFDILLQIYKFIFH